MSTILQVVEREDNYCLGLEELIPSYSPLSIFLVVKIPTQVPMQYVMNYLFTLVHLLTSYVATSAKV